jgi:Cu+-exporting ATPase
MVSQGVDIRGTEKDIKALEEQGKTVMLVSRSGSLVGLLALADTLKEHSRKAVLDLIRMGKEVVLMTGDNRKTGEAVAEQLGISNVMAEVLPGGKAEGVKRLQTEGRAVAMVGDGINDAPALAQADLGVAVGSGTDIAKESGDIVLVKDNLGDVALAMDLSSYTMAKVKQNLFWAFIYNIIGIPVAAGILYPVNGFLLNPMIAGAMMAFSSVSVVTNSLMMKRYRQRQ